MDQEGTDFAPDAPAVDLAHALERTDTLGQAIEEALDAAEREIEEIRRIGIPRASSLDGNDM